MNALYSKIDSIISPLRNEYEKDRVTRRYSIEYFTNQHDYKFLNLAYRTLFGRVPDKDALQIYLPLLRKAKRSKKDILVDLRYSPEGVANGIIIEGLHKRKLFAKATKIPYIKKILQWLEYIVDFPKNSRNLANLEYNSYQKELKCKEQTNDHLTILLQSTLANSITGSFAKNDTPLHSVKKLAIHQVLLGYFLNETILFQAQTIQSKLTEDGYDSELFIQYPQTNDTDSFKTFHPSQLSEQDGVIIHYSIGYPYIEKLLEIKGVKTLIFHGITPADYFEPYSQEYAKLLEVSRTQLRSLNNSFDFVYSDSLFETESLKYMGYENVSLLKPIIKAQTEKKNEVILEQRGDSKVILFRGDILPQNEILDMVEVLYWLKKIEPLAKLIIIGEDTISTAYDREVKSTLENYSLQNDFIITGKQPSDKCSSYYNIASLYLSLSSYIEEPTGLATALYNKLPIVALKSSTAEEILGKSKLLIESKQDKLLIVGLIALIFRDNKTKEALLYEQEAMNQQYTSQTLLQSYEEFIKRLTNAQT